MGRESLSSTEFNPQYANYETIPDSVIYPTPELYRSPTSILGDLTLRLFIGHGMAGEVMPGVNTLGTEAIGYDHGLEAITDTVYVAETLTIGQQRGSVAKSPLV